MSRDPFMNHDLLREKLFVYFDAETAAEEKREVEAHVDLCADCREIFKRWQTAAGVFQQAGNRPSEGFVYQVMERIADSEKRTSGVSVPKPVFLKWLLPVLGYTFA